jgi:hypothetical protein
MYISTNNPLKTEYQKTMKTPEKEVPGNEDKFVSSKDELSLREQIDTIKKGRTDEKPLKTVQYSDNHGQLKHVVLSFDSRQHGETRNQVLNMYETLFTKLEPDTKFTVIVQGDAAKEEIGKIIEKNNVPNPERIVFEKNDRTPSIWARDMMVSVFSPDYPHMNYIINPETIHSRDKDLPELLDRTVDSLEVLYDTALVTDGGDVLSNRNESVVGYDSLRKTAFNIQDMVLYYPEFNKWTEDFYINTMNGDEIKVNTQEMFEDLAGQLFEEYFGKPVIVVGKDDPETPAKEVPAVFHQDMAITPIDDKTFFLGDPELFDKMVAEMPVDERKKAEEQLSEIAGYSVDFDQYIRYNNTPSSLGTNNPADFNAYKKTLEERGYDVIRLPFKFSQTTSWPSFTYNNCIMENFEKDGKEVKRVFLPTVGVDYFDNHAIKEYEKQGFEVHPVPMGHVSKLQGTIRCSTNWLERSERA